MIFSTVESFLVNITNLSIFLLFLYDKLILGVVAAEPTDRCGLLRSRSMIHYGGKKIPKIQNSPTELSSLVSLFIEKIINCKNCFFLDFDSFYQIEKFKMTNPHKKIPTPKKYQSPKKYRPP